MTLAATVLIIAIAFGVASPSAAWPGGTTRPGCPFLQRYLPFWAANLVDRLWVMLVPIIAVVVPLGRVVPAS